MPELPEVETIRIDLEKFLPGKEISSLEILSPKTVKNNTAFFKKKLLGHKFSKISRRGKLLFFQMTNSNDFLLIHLKMTGQLIYLNKKNRISGGHSLSEESFETAVGGALPNKYTRLYFVFKDGGQLFFNDLRKFGYLRIVNQEELEKIITENYGPEPLDRKLNASYLAHIFAKRLRPIKSLLLDQKLIAGLGNIYVDESLFLAGIRPNRLGKSISKKEIEKLVLSIKRVIRLALKNRGTTFNNYLDSQGKKGNFSRLLNVYGRGGEKCYHCGQKIKKMKLGGRGTHYCLNCQK